MTPTFEKKSFLLLFCKLELIINMTVIAGTKAKLNLSSLKLNFGFKSVIIKN